MSFWRRLFKSGTLKGEGMPKIGILFDIDDLGGGMYGYEAYKIFFSSIDPRLIPGCTITDGDTQETLAGGARHFCIAVESTDQSTVDIVRAAMSKASAKGLLPVASRFLEAASLMEEPLPLSFRINHSGDLVDVEFQSAVEALKECRGRRLSKTSSKWIHMGDVLAQHATHYPDKLGCQDKNKDFTFKEWNERSCRLANGLADMKCGHKDRFAVLAFNRVEWMEIYAGCAKGGQICVPLMFRLAGPEIDYIVNDSQCNAMIVEKPLVDLVDGIKDKLSIPAENYIYLGDPGDTTPPGYVGYEDWLASASAEEPDTVVDAADTWTFMYTSGTTGRPKGVVRTHESYLAQYYLDMANMALAPSDKVLMVMPMCHVNSIFYSFPYTLVTAPVCVYNESSFDPVDFLTTVEKYRITFTSLVPTHYIVILSLPDEIKKKYDVSSMRQLLISSAPARKDTKVEILEFFSNAELWEAYGSTEAGLVTLCRPEDQLRKLGTIGTEIFGIDRIKVLDEDGNELPDGEVGELYARTPMLFKEYWNLPEKTKEVFQGEWFTAGDMCYRDPDGFYVLVDRKANMIISGGENIFPSEVENAIGSHPAVKDVAVIGVPHDKWGESVHAVIIPHEGTEPTEALGEEIRKLTREKIAGYKVPKTIAFIPEDEMPRTGTGKILHRVLREQYGKWSDSQ